MPKVHITKEIVEGLERPSSGRIDYFDDVLRGFGVRVSALKSDGSTKAQERTAGKTYFTMRRVNGKLVRTKIDTADKITAEKARKRAESELADMGKGIDPNQEKRDKTRQREAQAKEAKKQAVTLGETLADFLEERKLKAGTKALYQKLFDLHLSDWLDLPVLEITAEMVRQRHKSIAKGKRGRTVLKKQASKGKLEKVEQEDPKRREASADGTMRVLRAVLNHAFADDEENGITRVNPVRTLSRKKTWFKVDRRRTRIKNKDLPAWHRAVMALDNHIMRDFLRFLLFTGLRRIEAATLKWEQVDFDEGYFTLIGGMSGVTKNKEYHTLPLSDYLHKLLLDRKEGLKTELIEAKAALARGGTLTPKQRQALHNRLALAESRLASPYVFPGEGKTGYIVEPKRAIDTVTAATGIVFTCHDLRRTFATVAESLDISKYAVKGLLNHRQEERDVTAGYIDLTLERLREPMQEITNKLQEYISTQHGQLAEMDKGKVGTH